MNHEGWNYNQAYSFKITHQPDEDLIHVKLWAGSKLVFDTGDLFDPDNSLKGGRLGVYCDSQKNVTWSHMSYR